MTTSTPWIRWKKRDHENFKRAILVYGAPPKITPESEDRDWTMFREIAKLEGKDDASFAEYFKYVRQDMGV
jgi:hypothetical protein